MNDQAPDTAPASGQASVYSKTYPLEFTGTAREYFGIWIVNLFLSIITVGIYTAWAKVRRMRYFYGNTHLDGHNLEYHAKPKSILIGRLIVVAVLVIYNVLVNLTPWAALLIIPYFIAIPWVINKAISFNARVTSYRNVHFNFHGRYWRAFLVYVVMPIVALFSLGLLAPVASKMSADYIGNNTRWGKGLFETNSPLKPLYKNLGMSLLFGVLAFILLAAVGGAIGAAIGSTGVLEALRITELMGEGDLGSDEEAQIFMGATIFSVIFVYASSFLVYLFYAAGVRNITYEATKLDGAHQLHSEISRFEYVWILFTNLVLTLLSVGLLRPWAAIRTWRYLADNTGIETTGDLSTMVAAQEDEGAAASAEFLDIEGIDFGL